MRSLVALAVCGAFAACGPSEPARTPGAEPSSAPESEPTHAEDSETPAPRPKRARPSPALPEIRVEGEVGGLDADAVDKIVNGASKDFERCWEAGVSKNELLSGSIELVVGVGGDGRSEHAFVRQSSIGARGTERCLLEALASRTFPRPVGGKVGVVKTSLTFDLASGHRAPVAWTKANVSEVLEGHAAELTACRQGSNARLAVSLYVEQIELPPPPASEDAGDGADADAGPTYAGRASSVGVAAADADAFRAAECIERVLLGASFAAPGDVVAKASFEL